LIAEYGLGDRFAFDQGDAFDPASLAQLPRTATVGIVSGLYELFPENAPVRASLAGLAEAVVPGGYLLYTGQPWHPQIEFIARALTSHRGWQRRGSCGGGRSRKWINWSPRPASRRSRRKPIPGGFSPCRWPVAARRGAHV
jgi:hypothetical protein